MNTRTRTILIAGALAASASSLGSQAADQDAYFARQMALGSGSPAPQAVVASRPVLPETARQLQRDRDFARQMALGSGDGNLLPDVVPPGADHAVAAAQVTDPESTDAGE